MLVQPLPFSGRLVELRVLRELASAAAGGTPTLLRLQGEGGFGKSRLLDEALRRAAPQGLVVQAVARSPNDIPLRPLFDLGDALNRDPWSAQLAAVRTATEALSHAESLTASSGMQLVRALVRACSAVAERRPLTIVFEDAHWMAEQPLQVLTDLAAASRDEARAGRACHALIAVTERPFETSAAAATILDRAERLSPQARRVRLAPFTELEITDLLRRLRGCRPAMGEVEELHRRSGGVPLLVDLLLAAQATASDADLAVPGDVAAAVDARLVALPPEDRLAVDALAVAGGAIGAATLAQLTGVDLASAERTLRRLASVPCCLVEEAAGGFVTRHPLLVERSLRAMTTSRSEQLHRRLAAVVLSGQASPGRVDGALHHLRAAGAPADAPTLATALATLAESAFDASGYRDAAAYARAALSVCENESGTRARLHEIAAASLFRHHDVDACLDQVRAGLGAARAAADAETEGRLLVTALWAELTFSRSYREPEGLRAYVDNVGHPPELRARLLEGLAQMAILSGRVAEGEELAHRARDLAVTSPHGATAEAGAWFALGLASWEKLDLEAAERQFLASGAAAARGGDRWAEVWGAGRLAVLTLQRGDLVVAARWGGTARQLAQSVADWSEESLALATVAQVELNRGALDRAEESAGEAIRRVMRSDYVWSPLVAWPVLSWVRVLRGDRAGAHAALDELARLGFRVSRHQRSGIDKLAGLDVAVERRPWRSAVAPRTAGAAALQAWLGVVDPVHATAAAGTLADLADAGVVYPQDNAVSVAHAVGSLLRLAGDSDAALGWYRRAIALDQRSGAQLAAALTHLSCAELQRSEGRDAETLAHLEAAADLADRHGLVAVQLLVDRQAASLDRASRTRLVPARPPAAAVLLMTDIVGSTRLTEAIGDSIWADHQEAHKALLRSCFTGEGGVEFDDRGDGLSAWFPAPASALRCAVAIQRASAAADPVDAGGQRICVRVALGHGAVTLQPHGNLSGLAVAATTRLLEFAAAGDIVADAAVAAEAYAVGLQATLLGDKTLRNITGTHRVYQIAMSKTPPVDGQTS